MAERARCLSAKRGAHLFARRAEKLLSDLAKNGTGTALLDFLAR
jgi:hypothetical protein